jgi:hypothetical protein
MPVPIADVRSRGSRGRTGTADRMESLLPRLHLAACVAGAYPAWPYHAARLACSCRVLLCRSASLRRLHCDTPFGHDVNHTGLDTFGQGARTLPARHRRCGPVAEWSVPAAAANLWRTATAQQQAREGAKSMCHVSTLTQQAPTVKWKRGLGGVARYGCSGTG